MQRAFSSDQQYLGLGPLESQVMDALWSGAGWRTVGGVLDELNARAPRGHAYSTIKTILGNLTEKGYVRKRAVARAHEYKAARSREEVERELVHRVMRPLIAGGNPLLAHVADEIATDDAVLERFQRLLSERRART